MKYNMIPAKIPTSFSPEVAAKIAEKLSILKMDENERNAYIRYQKDVVTYNDAIETALWDGVREGLERGIEQGLEQGEYKAKIEIARSMLSKGFNLNQVTELTGLKEDEIKSSMD
jgi:predicted transposase/invertase (TIGR01784 family)